MEVDTLPKEFGKFIDVNVDAIFRKDGIKPEDYKTSPVPLIQFEGDFKKSVEVIFKSLTGKSLENVVRIYFFNDKEFENKFTFGTTAEYGHPIDPTTVQGYQSGYRIYMRSGKKRDITFINILHEIGGTLIPHTIENTSGIDYTIEAKTDSTFLLELSQFYFMYAGLTKWCLETTDKNDEPPFFSADMSKVPMHYHANNEAIRLLSERKSPLMEYREHYEGTINLPNNPVRIHDLNNGCDGWIDSSNPLYSKGGKISFKPFDIIKIYK